MKSESGFNLAIASQPLWIFAFFSHLSPISGLSWHLERGKMWLTNISLECLLSHLKFEIDANRSNIDSNACNQFIHSNASTTCTLRTLTPHCNYIPGRPLQGETLHYGFEIEVSIKLGFMKKTWKKYVPDHVYLPLQDDCTHNHRLASPWV